MRRIDFVGRHREERMFRTDATSRLNIVSTSSPCSKMDPLPFPCRAAKRAAKPVPSRGSWRECIQDEIGSISHPKLEEASFEHPWNTRAYSSFQALHFHPSILVWRKNRTRTISVVSTILSVEHLYLRVASMKAKVIYKQPYLTPRLFSLFMPVSAVTLWPIHLSLCTCGSDSIELAPCD